MIFSGQMSGTVNILGHINPLLMTCGIHVFSFPVLHIL